MAKNFVLNLDHNETDVGRGELIIKGMFGDVDMDELGGIPIVITIPDELLAYAKNEFIKEGEPSTFVVRVSESPIVEDNTVTIVLSGSPE